MYAKISFFFQTKWYFGKSMVFFNSYLCLRCLLKCKNKVLLCLCGQRVLVQACSLTITRFAKQNKNLESISNSVSASNLRESSRVTNYIFCTNTSQFRLNARSFFFIIRALHLKDFCQGVGGNASYAPS